MNPGTVVMLFSRLREALVFAAIAPLLSWAQPSGGPYGPLAQTYELPSGAASVLHVAPNGSTSNAGKTLEQPTTLESALARAVTGDVIVLRGGTYRTGSLRLNQGVTLQPYRDEHPVLKGTQVADKWEAQSNGLWRTSWTRLFPSKPESWWRRNREGRRTPLYLFNNDMVFVDGKPLRTVGWEGEIDDKSFSIDYASGHVYIGVDPTNRLVEITAHDSALRRVAGELNGRRSDGKGPVLRGLTITQYAFRAIEIEGKDPEGVSPEANHGKDVVGTTLEHVTISHCSRVGGYFRGDRMVFRHCRISDTSTEGIFILSSNDVLLEKNIFERNNVEKITGYYPAAVKIFNQCYRVVCRDNLVREQPSSNGIWYDVGNVDGVFVNNWIEGALDGFFFEISKGAICAGNVFVDCDKGIRILNASNVQIYHNTLVNTVASFERNTRSAVGDHFGWHPATGPEVEQRDGHVFVGNVLAAREGFAKAMLRFEQPESLRERLTRPHVQRLDDNLYVCHGEASSRPLIVWTPAPQSAGLLELKSPAEVRKLHAEFESRSRYLNGYYGSIFRSPELGRYELAASAAPAMKSELPVAVKKALGWRKEPAVPGAFQ